MSSCRTTTAPGIGATLGGRPLAGLRRLHEASQVGPNGEPVTLGLRLWYFADQKDVRWPCKAGAICSLRFRWELWRRRRKMIPTIIEWGGSHAHIRAYIRRGDSGNIPVFAQESNDGR